MRRSELRRKRAQALLMGLVTAALVVVLGAAWFWRAATAVIVPLDQNLCPREELVAEEILFILDATDEWSEVRRLAVRRELAAVRDGLPRFARVSVHVVEPTQTPGSTRRVTLCNPGTLAQIDSAASEYRVARRAISNEQLIGMYRNRYQTVLDSAISETGREGPLGTSPIMETIRQAVMTTPSDDVTQLYVVSDMYQNSAAFNAYERPDWPEAVADSLADVTRLGTQELIDVDITMFLLSPPGIPSDPDAIRHFWTMFFESQGAILRRIERLEA